MAVNATVTGVTGGAQTITAMAVPGISNINFDWLASIVKITFTPTGLTTPRTMELALGSLTTISFSISGGNTAIVLS